jgi:hypothetical protein
VSASQRNPEAARSFISDFYRAHIRPGARWTAIEDRVGLSTAATSVEGVQAPEIATGAVAA